MAKVVVKLLGGQLQEQEARTVGGLKQALNVPTYAASVNGDPANDSYELQDHEFVTLSPAVKGG